MNEFSASVVKGISAAEEAQRSLYEITSVIKRMAAAVEDATDGKVKVVRSQVSIGDTTTNIARALLQIGTAAEPGKKIHVLTLQSAKNAAEKKEIARLDIPTSGYPCVVIRGANRETCFDEKSLVEALKELLESPEVGKAIATLRETISRP